MNKIEEMKDKYFKTGYNPTEKEFEKDLVELTKETIRDFIEWFNNIDEIKKHGIQLYLESIDRYLKENKK